MVWFLAFCSLRQRPIRTFLTALGIAVAVGSTVIFLSIGEGLRQVFTQQVSSLGPDLQVSFGPFSAEALTAVPELPLAYLADLRRDAERYDITTITPLLVFLRAGFSPTASSVYQGIPADTDVTALYYGYSATQGRTLTPEDEGAFVAVAGEQAAARSNLAVGDTVSFNPRVSFEVVGIARSSGGLVDNTLLVPLSSLQQAIGFDDRVSFFAITLNEPGRAQEVAASLSERYSELGFQTRGEVLGVIEQGIAISDVVRLGISTIALVVGAIAVANTVLMSVFERTREFGVVRALGAKPRFLFALVLAESVLLSLVGAALGVLLGRGGIALVNRVAVGLVGLEVAVLTLRLVGFALAVALTVGLVSGLLPAARAARIPIAAAMARE